MTLRDCMLYAGIRTSRRFAGLTWFQRDFFYGLLHAAWPAGRFEADVGVLRAALYAPMLLKVSPRDVQDALVKCRELGLVKLWTDDSGRGWGEVVNYRQHGLKKRKRSDEEPPPEPPPADDGPELFPKAGPPPDQIEGKKEGRGRAREARNPSPSQFELQEDWLARMQRAFPEANVLAELDKAKRKKGQVDRVWFEKSWLPNCGPAVEFATAKGALLVAEPEPEGWKVYLKDEYDGAGFGADAGNYDWPTMPPAWRTRIVREMKAKGLL